MNEEEMIRLASENSLADQVVDYDDLKAFEELVEEHMPATQFSNIRKNLKLGNISPYVTNGTLSDSQIKDIFCVASRKNSANSLYDSNEFNGGISQSLSDIKFVNFNGSLNQKDVKDTVLSMSAKFRMYQNNIVKTIEACQEIDNENHLASLIALNDRVSSILERADIIAYDYPVEVEPDVDYNSMLSFQSNSTSLPQILPDNQDFSAHSTSAGEARRRISISALSGDGNISNINSQLIEALTLVDDHSMIAATVLVLRRGGTRAETLNAINKLLQLCDLVGEDRLAAVKAMMAAGALPSLLGALVWTGDWPEVEIQISKVISVLVTYEDDWQLLQRSALLILRELYSLQLKSQTRKKYQASIGQLNAPTEHVRRNSNDETTEVQEPSDGSNRSDKDSLTTNHDLLSQIPQHDVQYVRLLVSGAVAKLSLVLTWDWSRSGREAQSNHANSNNSKRVSYRTNGPATINLPGLIRTSSNPANNTNADPNQILPVLLSLIHLLCENSLSVTNELNAHYSFPLQAAQQPQSTHPCTPLNAGSPRPVSGRFDFDIPHPLATGPVSCTDRLSIGGSSGLQPPVNEPPSSGLQSSASLQSLPSVSSRIPAHSFVDPCAVLCSAALSNLSEMPHCRDGLVQGGALRIIKNWLEIGVIVFNQAKESCIELSQEAQTQTHERGSHVHLGTVTTEYGGGKSVSPDLKETVSEHSHQKVGANKTEAAYDRFMKKYAPAYELICNAAAALMYLCGGRDCRYSSPSSKPFESYRADSARSGGYLVGWIDAQILSEGLPAVIVKLIVASTSPDVFCDQYDFDKNNSKLPKSSTPPAAVLPAALGMHLSQVLYQLCSRVQNRHQLQKIGVPFALGLLFETMATQTRQCISDQSPLSDAAIGASGSLENAEGNKVGVNAAPPSPSSNATKDFALTSLYTSIFLFGGVYYQETHSALVAAGTEALTLLNSEHQSTSDLMSLYSTSIDNQNKTYLLVNPKVGTDEKNANPVPVGSSINLGRSRNYSINTTLPLPNRIDVVPHPNRYFNWKTSTHHKHSSAIQNDSGSSSRGRSTHEHGASHQGHSKHNFRFVRNTSHQDEGDPSSSIKGSTPSQSAQKSSGEFFQNISNDLMLILSSITSSALGALTLFISDEKSKFNSGINLGMSFSMGVGLNASLNNGNSMSLRGPGGGACVTNGLELITTASQTGTVFSIQSITLPDLMINRRLIDSILLAAARIPKGAGRLAAVKIMSSLSEWKDSLRELCEGSDLSAIDVLTPICFESDEYRHLQIVSQATHHTSSHHTGGYSMFNLAKPSTIERNTSGASSNGGASVGSRSSGFGSFYRPDSSQHDRTTMSSLRGSTPTGFGEEDDEDDSESHQFAEIGREETYLVCYCLANIGQSNPIYAQRIFKIGVFPLMSKLVRSNYVDICKQALRCVGIMCSIASHESLEKGAINTKNDTIFVETLDAITLSLTSSNALVQKEAVEATAQIALVNDTVRDKIVDGPLRLIVSMLIDPTNDRDIRAAAENVLKNIGFHGGEKDFELCGFDFEILKDWYGMNRSLVPQDKAHEMLLEWIDDLFDIKVDDLPKLMHRHSKNGLPVQLSNAMEFSPVGTAINFLSAYSKSNSHGSDKGANATQLMNTLCLAQPMGTKPIHEEPYDVISSSSSSTQHFGTSSASPVPHFDRTVAGSFIRKFLPFCAPAAKSHSLFISPHPPEPSAANKIPAPIQSPSSGHVNHMNRSSSSSIAFHPITHTPIRVERANTIGGTGSSTSSNFGNMLQASSPHSNINFDWLDIPPSFVSNILNTFYISKLHQYFLMDLISLGSMILPSVSQTQTSTSSTVVPTTASAAVVSYQRDSNSSASGKQVVQPVATEVRIVSDADTCNIVRKDTNEEFDDLSFAMEGEDVDEENIDFVFAIPKPQKVNAILFPSRTYQSFNRVGRVLEKMFEYQSSATPDSSVPAHSMWSLMFRESYYSGDFHTSLISCLRRCPQICSLTFASSGCVEDDALLGHLAGQIPPSVRFLIFRNSLSKESIQTLCISLVNNNAAFTAAEYDAMPAANANYSNSSNAISSKKDSMDGGGLSNAMTPFGKRIRGSNSNLAPDSPDRRISLPSKGLLGLALTHLHLDADEIQHIIDVLQHSASKTFQTPQKVTGGGFFRHLSGRKSSHESSGRNMSSNPLSPRLSESSLLRGLRFLDLSYNSLIDGICAKLLSAALSGPLEGFELSGNPIVKATKFMEVIDEWNSQTECHNNNQQRTDSMHDAYDSNRSSHISAAANLDKQQPSHIYQRHTLKYLGLSNTGISSKSINVLLNKLMYNESLTALDLSCNEIESSPSTNETIRNFLKNNKALRMLDLSYNKLNLDSFKQIHLGVISNNSLVLMPLIGNPTVEKATSHNTMKIIQEKLFANRLTYKTKSRFDGGQSNHSFSNHSMMNITPTTTPSALSKSNTNLFSDPSPHDPKSEVRTGIVGSDTSDISLSVSLNSIPEAVTLPFIVKDDNASSPLRTASAPSIDAMSLLSSAQSKQTQVNLELMDDEDLPSLTHVKVAHDDSSGEDITEDKKHLVWSSIDRENHSDRKVVKITNTERILRADAATSPLRISDFEKASFQPSVKAESKPLSSIKIPDYKPGPDDLIKNTDKSVKANLDFANENSAKLSPPSSIQYSVDAVQHNSYESLNSLNVLFSAPLAGYDRHSRPQPLEVLDYTSERDMLIHVFQEVNRDVSLHFDFATADSLRTALSFGCKALHFSGHGIPQGLCFEDSRSGLQVISIEHLKRFLSAGGLTLQFVFVSACYSKEIGEAFVKAGVPHVVCVKIDSKIQDVAAIAFTRAFYIALLSGKTVQDSFDIAREALRMSPYVPDSILEGEKFILLPEVATASSAAAEPSTLSRHNKAIFVNRAIPSWPCESRHCTMGRNRTAVKVGLARNNLLSPPSDFEGREIVMHKLITNILDKKLVSLTGEDGVGKTSVALAVCKYVADREMFEDSVVFVRCKGIRDYRSFLTVLHNALMTSGSHCIMDRMQQISRPNLHAIQTALHNTSDSASLSSVSSYSSNHQNHSQLLYPEEEALLVCLQELKVLLVMDHLDDLLQVQSLAPSDFKLFLDRLFDHCHHVKVLVVCTNTLNMHNIRVLSVVETSVPLGPLSVSNTLRLFARLAPSLSTAEDRNRFIEAMQPYAKHLSSSQLYQIQNTSAPSHSSFAYISVQQILALFGNGNPSKIVHMASESTAEMVEDLILHGKQINAEGSQS